MLDVFEGFGDFLAAGDFTAAEISGRVLKDYDIAGEKRCMCSGEIQLHAVMSGDRINVHALDDGYSCHDRLIPPKIYCYVWEIW